MTAVFLLIWFWLYAGLLFTNTMTGMQLFEYVSGWKKVIFWPYYTVVAFVQYYKANKNEEENDTRTA